MRGRPLRTFPINVLHRSHCGGRLRLVAAITDRTTVRKVLEHLGASAELAIARPRASELTGAVGGGASVPA